ncbi:MAG: hypothetical protein L6435_00700 [Anaerolineae bacterium]|nr:hypothetical protein [Anaerolineae bacterium]
MRERKRWKFYTIVAFDTTIAAIALTYGFAVPQISSIRNGWDIFYLWSSVLASLLFGTMLGQFLSTLAQAWVMKQDKVDMGETLLFCCSHAGYLTAWKEFEGNKWCVGVGLFSKGCTCRVEDTQKKVEKLKTAIPIIVGLVILVCLGCLEAWHVITNQRIMFSAFPVGIGVCITSGIVAARNWAETSPSRTARLYRASCRWRESRRPKRNRRT